MDLGLADRIYILTGASRGLGFATAQSLVADGAKVVISSRDPDRVAEAVEELGGEKFATGVVADLTDPETPRELLDSAYERYGRVDGALISVGGPVIGTAAGVSDDDWRRAFETVFLGQLRAARVFASALPAGGAIGIILSSSVKVPLAGLGLSNGLRPGLAMAMKDMADEYGPRGVRFVGLMPGRIMTNRNRELFEATGDATRAEVDVAASVPMRRLGEPHEFGRVAAFVLSPAASYLTGLVLPIDGGYTRTL